MVVSQQNVSQSSPMSGLAAVRHLRQGRGYCSGLS